MTRRNHLECSAGLAGAFSESMEDDGPGAIPQQFVCEANYEKMLAQGSMC